MKEVQALTEYLCLVVSFDPKPLARMKWAQTLTKPFIDFLVAEKFLHYD
ncbi:MAG: hypothetical protein WBO09_17300 [Methylocystis silviterrae]